MNSQAIYFQDFDKSFLPHILKEIYLDRVYAPYIRSNMDVIVDIGANIGMTSMYFRNFAKTVYALEPAKEHFNCINKLIKNNKYENIIPINKAVSAKTGKTTFYHSDNDTMYSMNQGVSNGTQEEVETITLIDFLNEYKIKKVDLLKMDVEGSEMDIVTSKGFADACTRVPLIIGEFHTWSGVSKDQFVNVFKDYGYSFKWTGVTEASTFVAQR